MGGNPSGQAVISVSDLTQHYGARPVLQQVSFEVRPGELTCVMGPNGMGKTTLLAAVAGLLSPRKGKILINGLRRRGAPEDELAIRRQFMYLPADAWLPKSQTGREYLLALGGLYGVDVDRLFGHAEQLLDLFELSEKADARMSDYSTGRQKKIALCGALVSEAPVMILDEPFSGGLDPSGLLVLKRIMARLAEREDVTVLMAAPVPEIAEEVADRILVLSHGKVAACRTVEELRKEAGDGATLEDALTGLLDPEAAQKLERYLAEANR